MAMPVSWRAGYEWAYHRLHRDKGSMAAAEAEGYDFDSPEWHQFMEGVEAAQEEQGFESE